MRYKGGRLNRDNNKDADIGKRQTAKLGVRGGSGLHDRAGLADGGDGVRGGVRGAARVSHVSVLGLREEGVDARGVEEREDGADDERDAGALHRNAEGGVVGHHEEDGDEDGSSDDGEEGEDDEDSEGEEDDEDDDE